MTSLIDIIFLLLLFFMLTSTFSKFAEVELAAAGASGAVSVDIRPLFLRLGADDLSLNGTELALEEIAGRLEQSVEPDANTPVLVSLGAGVTAQRLTDLLVALRPVRGVAVTVLGS